MVELSNSEYSFSGSRPTNHQQTLRLSVIRDQDAAIEFVNNIPETWVHSSYQHPRLVTHWLKQADTRPFIVTIQTAGGPVILPLQEHDDCTAGYIGGRHANGNFPLGAPHAINAMETFNRKDLHHALRREPMRPCLLVLERQLRSVGILTNPFVDTLSTRSPNVALSFSIKEGFDHVLAQRNAKRIRKKVRSSQRKLEAFGAFDIITADGPEQTEAFLQRFFALKSKRFKELGIFDVFADRQTRSVFSALFAEDPLNRAKVRYKIHALCLDERPIAVIGCSEFQSRVTVEFGAFDDEFAFASPGDLLFFQTIEQSSCAGFEFFDFGIGDEIYKRRWSDIETWHADTFIATSLRGQLIARAKEARTNAIRALKSNQKLWAVAKRLRKQFSGVRSGQ